MVSAMLVNFECVHVCMVRVCVCVLQAIQEDLVKGFRHCVKSRVEIQQDKVQGHRSFMSSECMRCSTVKQQTVPH